MEGLKFRGRPPILIAKSIKDIVALRNEYVKVIMDRSQPIDNDFVNAIVSQSVMSWEGRKPRPALDQDGNFRCTDLDLLSFLYPVAARGAVIEIPRYRNRRQVVLRPDERKIGSNQFGPLTGLVSNKDVFSFSVQILDKTIVRKNWRTGKEEVGAPRNYMVVDCDGHWYTGWDKIVWDPSAAENRFLTEKGLWTGNTVYFKNYVHPNRWQSVFGAAHLLKKWLIARLDDEAGFYRAEMKRLEAKGIKLPSLPPREKPVYLPPTLEGETVPISVRTLEMVLDIPEFSGNYRSVPSTPKGLLATYRRQKLLTYVLKPFVQFGVRANEVAYFLHGINARDNSGKIAFWMEGRSWQPGWKASRGRTEWNIMVLSPDVALRWRAKTLTQRVSAD